MFSISSIGSIIAAGACFMLANLAMKLLGDKPFFVLYPAVSAAIVIGCWFQVVAFREAQFGLAVVLILGLEMLFSILVARAFLGEIYSSTNIIGVMLVIAGMGLVHVPADAQPGPDEAPEIFRDAKIEKVRASNHQRTGTKSSESLSAVAPKTARKPRSRERTAPRRSPRRPRHW